MKTLHKEPLARGALQGDGRSRPDRHLYRADRAADRLGHRIILYSEMCGVVDRVLIDNEQVVCSGQELIELRNTNVSRDKAGKKMQPASLPIPKPFFKQKNSQINMTDSGLENNTSNLPVPKPVSFFSVKKNLIRQDLHSSVSENAILRLLPYRL